MAIEYGFMCDSSALEYIGARGGTLDELNRLIDDGVSYYEISSLYDYAQFFSITPELFKKEVLPLIMKKAEQADEIRHFQKSLDAIYK